MSSGTPIGDPGDSFVLTLSCADRVGIVSAVSGLLAGGGINISESQQFGDASTGLFFMRVQAVSGHAAALGAVREGMERLAQEFGMSWRVHEMRERPRVLLLVSRAGHCLNDLLYRYRIGALHAEIPAIVSNHLDFADLAAAAGIPFHHLPVARGDAAAKVEQEARIRALIEDLRIDTVVLARYMQILTPDLANFLRGRAINIHHGLLPSFKGAGPYRQAYDRGVKIIGATAHYVTADLDEGPIISQVVAHVDHTAGPQRLADMGRDLECQALAQAVSWHLERRVFLNGAKTVVFR